MCDLLNNNRLKTITEILGATHVEYLTLRLYKNFNYFKRLHLKGFKNLNYLHLSNNSIFYIEQDLLTDLPKLSSLNLGEANLHNVTSLFKSISAN